MRQALLAAAFACGAQLAGAQAPPVEVKIQDYKFIPAEVTIRQGASVRWTNAEKRTTHSVLFVPEKLESERLLPGESYQRRFDRPGTYAYTCGPHPEMKGIVIVTP